MSRLGVVVLVLSLLSVACGVMSLPVDSDVLPKPSPESHQIAQEAPGTKFDGNLTRTTSTTELCVSAAETLNLRLAPSTSAPADPNGLQHGNTVVRIGAVPGWLKVQAGDRVGWVKAEYIGGCK